MAVAQKNARMGGLPLRKTTGNYIIARRSHATLPGFVLPSELFMSTQHDLKNAGLKATLPRLKIINLFETSKVRHLTAEDVYKQLLAEGLDVGLATVYRVLTQFEQAGLLVRHHFESGKAVFELNQGGHHDHLVCLQCGRVEEFFDPEIEKRQTRIARERGFEISEHALYLYAECTRVKCPYRKPGGHD
jgi:Fur family ferric uptake transcriptional regulator